MKAEIWAFPKLLLGLVLLSSLSLPACSRRSSGLTIVRWEGARIEDVEWKVNGKAVGKGLDGFQNILVHLRSLDDGASLLVQYPSLLWNETIPGFREDDMFPFRQHDDLRKELELVLIEKKLTSMEEGY